MTEKEKIEIKLKMRNPVRLFLPSDIILKERAKVIFIIVKFHTFASERFLVEKK